MARVKSRRPVMRVLDVLGRRWALRILWELRNGARTFRALRAACDDVSPSSLNQRLAELRTLGAIERRDEGYALTPPGVRLGAIVLELHRWAEAMRPRAHSPFAVRPRSPKSRARGSAAR
jgi:DNA-binding HxlR family transcriptional regulator